MKKHLMIIFTALCFSMTGQATTRLNGAGASFPYPIYVKWFSEYQKLNPDTQFNYKPIGSGGGIRQLMAETVDFGASDVPIKDKEMKKFSYPVLEIPMVIGAVTVVFNLGEKGPRHMDLDGPTLAAIYLGDITYWNDSRILALNKGMVLPDKPIMVVRRSESSGTTAIFTGYLSKVSSRWKEEVGAGKAVRWKVGFGGKGNDGVTAIVEQTEGAIGYVELAYALNNQLSYARLMNPNRELTLPKLSNISQSAKGLTKKSGVALISKRLVGDISNSREHGAYPITSMTYFLLPLKGQNEQEIKSIKKFVKWAMKHGDSHARKLHYAPLPEAMKEKVLKTLKAL